jgi:serine/threonine protein kinase
MPFVLGGTIGPYRLVEQLGQGGMATVYKAYHPALDRCVAIKALHPAFLEDPNFLARFQREARMVAKLEHPNIVPIYDFSEHEGRPYLVMKYIEGQTLKAHLSNPPIPVAEILRITDAVGAALQYAHERNILHRDIKPSNVILSGDGAVFLADFGLARIAQGSTSTLTSDMLVGTPQYISPEQAQSVTDLDGRTDIYSFGVMLYEMFVGRVPFSADTPFSIIHDHIYTPLPLPRLVNPGVSERLEQVLLKALAKNRDDRFASVNELVQALHGAVEAAGTLIPAVPIPSADKTAAAAAPPPDTSSSQTQVSPAVPASPSPSGPQKRQVWLWILGSMVLAFLLLASLGGLYRARQDRIAAQTVAPSVTETAEPAVQAGSAALSQEGLPPEALQALDIALEQWKNGSTAEAYAAIVKAIESLQDNPAYTTAAVNYTLKQDAWALAAMIGSEYYRRHPNEFTPEQLLRLHETLYRAAGDEGADQFYQDFDKNPLFQVARMRHELYFSSGAEGIKEDLGRLIEQPLILRRFPEAKLLEVEMYLKLGDNNRARQLQEKLLKDRSLPEWVHVMTQDLEAKLK